MSAEVAADYVGVGLTVFLWEVKQQIWPPPEKRGPRGGRNVWDRDLIDQAYDRRSKLDRQGKAGAASGGGEAWMSTLPGQRTG